MNTVALFPRFNLDNIPEALRMLALRIEADPALAVRMVAVIENEAGDATYHAFGAGPFPRAHAIGLCFGVAQMIVAGDQA